MFIRKEVYEQELNELRREAFDANKSTLDALVKQRRDLKEHIAALKLIKQLKQHVDPDIYATLYSEYEAELQKIKESGSQEKLGY